VTSDSHGRIQLHYAALEDDSAATERLLADGADVNAPDQDGFTPLHFAAQARGAASARVLLDHGASVDAQNAHGNSPLFVAVFNSKGDGAVIELLRASGANPNLANHSGQTPVGLARLIGNYPVSQFFDDLDDGD
jgi:uncharacterized protein